MPLVDTLMSATFISPLLEKALPSVLGTLMRSHSLKLKGEALRSAYRFEVRANLDLIEALNFSALKDTDVSAPEFYNFTTCLQTEIGASILYDMEHGNLRAFKKSLMGINAQVSLESEGETGCVKNLFDAMDFSVRKIELLKRIALCAQNGSHILHDFRLSVRLKNIHANLLEIANKLCTQEE